MTQWTDAERFLLDRVRQRDGDAWAQLVARYQGRLIAFARGRGVSSADAEDLVQDTFLLLLRGIEKFRGEATLETFLFVLLRNRIVDWLRVRRVHATLAGEDVADGQPLPPQATGTGASFAVQSDELQRDKIALASAIVKLVEEFRLKLDFRGLQMAEMIFYAQMRNNAIAQKTGTDEKHIGVLKHRWIKRLRTQVEPARDKREPQTTAESTLESLLSEVWEEYRPSCPKRSTLGGYLLNTLDSNWHDYIDFHVQSLGCRFCTANLDDLRLETATGSDRFRARVMESSVGFFRPGV